MFTTLDDIFDSGVKGGENRPFLGHRPILSTNPLKHANHFVWQSYGDVDIRRRHVGSALTSMFKDGTLGGGDYDTVGLWSMNRPGTSVLRSHYWLGIYILAEWQIINIALESYNKVSVSLYDTLGNDSVGQSLFFMLFISLLLISDTEYM